MTNPYTVSDLIAEFLSACGVEVAFGIVSIHNVPMLDAISRANRIRFVATRGELAAGHMADGYARASGQLGVLVTSTGPGAANAVGGLVEARFASSPLLHITGQTSTKYVDRGMGTVHDIPDQLGIMGASCKAAYRIRDASQALAVLRKAASEAMTFPRGPVTVEVPTDVQRAELSRPVSLETLTLEPGPQPTGDAAGIEALIEAGRKARRPVLWLGRGAAHAGPAATRLLDLGWGMVTSWAGRGVVSESHPRNLGPLNGNGLEPVEDFYETCDLMVVAGSRLRGHETGEFTTKLPARIFHVDLDPAADGRTYKNIGFAQADASDALTRLADALESENEIDPAFAEAFEALKVATRASFRSTLGPYAGFAEQLQEHLPRDAIWARDITINNSTWGNRLLRIHDTRSNLYPIGAGIGQGFSLGIGGALAANGRKTVVMTGDGGFYMHLGELWTALQENIDMTILVMNDRGYGVIRHIQDKAAEGRRRFDVIDGPNLESLCRDAGIPYWRVTDADAFGATAGEAIAHHGVSMVEVDMTVIGDHPPYWPYGPKAPRAGTTDSHTCGREPNGEAARRTE